MLNSETVKKKYLLCIKLYLFIFGTYEMQRTFFIIERLLKAKTYFIYWIKKHVFCILFVFFILLYSIIKFSKTTLCFFFKVYKKNFLFTTGNQNVYFILKVLGHIAFSVSFVVKWASCLHAIKVLLMLVF